MGGSSLFGGPPPPLPLHFPSPRVSRERGTPPGRRAHLTPRSPAEGSPKPPKPRLGALLGLQGPHAARAVPAPRAPPGADHRDAGGRGAGRETRGAVGASPGCVRNGFCFGGKKRDAKFRGGRRKPFKGVVRCFGGTPSLTPSVKVVGFVGGRGPF